MNNIVVLLILALFGLAIMRIAWNNRIKYSYGSPDIEDSTSKELSKLQQLDDSEVKRVNSSMKRTTDPTHKGSKKRNMGSIGQIAE